MLVSCLPRGLAPLKAVLCLALLVIWCPSTASAKREPASPLPNIVFLLIDDWGWADVGYHRPPGYGEIQSPNIDAIVKDGITLDRHYVFKFCSPTRSAIQSGRNPIHVNAQNVGMQNLDPENPLNGVSGIPVNMTGFAQRLADVGYKHRVFAGKADFGMAYAKSTPLGRGYTDALFYFNHMNDYWSLNVGTCREKGGVTWTRDLYGTNEDGSVGPQYHLLNPRHCWVQNMTSPEIPVAPFPKNLSDCVYEEDLFTNFTVRHIMAHNQSEGPLLAFHAAHSIHTPLEVVPPAYDRFAQIDFHARRAYHAMVFNVDLAVGRIVDALKAKGMWENTLLVCSSDNGGPIYKQGNGGANNFPLKGGKAGNWEGGIRVNAFVGGGAVPTAMRGRTLDGLITGWDWYSTFVQGIAGLDPTDREAEAAGLPPLDSVNQWDYIMGRTTVAPRTELPIGTTADPRDLWAAKNDIVVHGLIKSEGGKLWKLLVGQVPQAIWTGPQFPNKTTATLPPAETVFGDCGFATGCLFELHSDPSELQDVSAANPGVVAALRTSLEHHNKTVFAPKRPLDPRACAAALSTYRDPNPEHDFGWWGPWM